MEMKNRDKEAVVDILAKYASASPTGPIAFYKNLVQKADLPQTLKMKWVGTFTGEASQDARALVSFLLAFGTNPKDKNAALGTLILPLVPADVGLEDASSLSAIMVAYNLVRAPDDVADLRGRFQIPQPLATGPYKHNASIGPTLDWAGPVDEVTLQSWLTPPPDFLDVALLRKAVDRARSVCRIEVAATGESGTGVLIDDDLVLTNYHVVTKDPALLQRNAESTILRFGAFTATIASAAKGQEVTLHATAPVVETSPTSQYDFVLLRTNKAIASASDICPTPILARAPDLRSALYILQHPEGGPMKLALSNNGVTWVDPAKGRVQYVTCTAGGSSGSPCFDANWNLVALHHAELARSFGSMREGILMESILEQIRPHTKATSTA
jgi:hypothetical protein